MRAAAGISADQDLAPQVPRKLGEREPGRLDVIGRGVRPGIPRPQHDGQRVPVPGRAVVGPGGLFGVPAMLALCFGAHFALSLFGIGYARAATLPLWFLSLSYVPELPKSFYVAVCRATGKISRAAVVQTTFAALEIVAAGIGGHFAGLKGLSIAIFAVTLIQGAATTPAVLKVASRRVAWGASLRAQDRRVRKTTQLSAVHDTSANTGGRLDYNQGRRTDWRSIISTEPLGIYNYAAYRSEQTNSYSRDQQAGIALLEWLASIQAPPEPAAQYLKPMLRARGDDRPGGEARERPSLMLPHHRPGPGHMMIKMSGHPPRPAQIILNGHGDVTHAAHGARIDFVKEGHCWTEIADLPRLGGDRRCFVGSLRLYST